MQLRYTGTPRSVSNLEAEFGKPPYPRGENSPRELYISKKIRALREVIMGKDAGSVPSDFEKSLLSDILLAQGEKMNGEKL